LRDKPSFLKRTVHLFVKIPTRKNQKKKPQIRKKAKPTKKAPTKIKCFLNPLELLTTIRKDTFCPLQRYFLDTPSVVATLSVEINKQLLFKFDANRRTNINLSRGLWSSVVTDLLEADYTGEKLQYHQLSRYVIDDVVTAEEGTPFLLCTTLGMDKERFDGLFKHYATE